MTTGIDELLKMPFHLESENEDWPPFNVEHIWLRKLDDFWQVRNCPQFIKGLCYDDQIVIETDETNSVIGWSIIKASTNSTIWILVHIKAIEKELLDNITSLGCSFEGGALTGYYSINVPITVEMQRIDQLFEETRFQGHFEAAFVTQRQH